VSEEKSEPSEDVDPSLM